MDGVPGRRIGSKGEQVLTFCCFS